MTVLDQVLPSAELPLLEVKDLAQRYTLPRESMFKPAGQVHALNGVTAQVMPAAASAWSANPDRASRPSHGS